MPHAAFPEQLRSSLPWMRSRTRIDPVSLMESRAFYPDLHSCRHVLKKDLNFDREIPFMMQLCLPVEEAPRLLRLLSFVRVDAAALIPGHDGVVAAIQERRF